MGILKTDVFAELTKAKAKIATEVIGTHFYQTLNCPCFSRYLNDNNQY